MFYYLIQINGICTFCWRWRTAGRTTEAFR